MENQTGTMEIKVFGKPDCKYCKTTMQKFETFLGRWEARDKVALTFHDMETVDGLAEGAFYGVTKIPSTVIEQKEDLLARWDGKVPLSREFEKFFLDLTPPQDSRQIN
ncbi:MAG: thioredoxin family protein [Candidatus Margulisbacteria bacterium]|nr:thioredoxin family protein [Candidatus Margulisiibacteriota bacterium]MBU1021778.1 thioredoxin family protein [Candidatus Margulisiibacteriota bacterium]MBU1729524.1 thioredoxin family protein [Candidatus Margulisiibacteriota bacterium]MBU1955375.1 thioredoxin family protein [Candidatus Margulisiibacteriota bacterium]